mmetsp:Transcript_17284/g.46913  ORF Transcript_17284/g.46913 Transcript_17284/m.46913 type:complete len:336 (+) Transcript_17284:449-1456(+)
MANVQLVRSCGGIGRVHQAVPHCSDIDEYATKLAEAGDCPTDHLPSLQGCQLLPWFRQCEQDTLLFGAFLHPDVHLLANLERIQQGTFVELVRRQPSILLEAHVNEGASKAGHLPNNALQVLADDHLLQGSFWCFGAERRQGKLAIVPHVFDPGAQGKAWLYGFGQRRIELRCQLTWKQHGILLGVEGPVPLDTYVDKYYAGLVVHNGDRAVQQLAGLEVQDVPSGLQHCDQDVPVLHDDLLDPHLEELAWLNHAIPVLGQEHDRPSPSYIDEGSTGFGGANMFDPTLEMLTHVGDLYQLLALLRPVQEAAAVSAQTSAMRAPDFSGVRYRRGNG